MEYTIYRAGFCPKCGSELFGCYNDHEFICDGVQFMYTCGSCGVSGSEYYSMELIDNVAED